MNDETESQLFGELVARGAGGQLREQILQRVEDELAGKQDNCSSSQLREPVRRRRANASLLAAAVLLVLGVGISAWVDYAARQRLHTAFGSTVAPRVTSFPERRMASAGSKPAASSNSIHPASLEATIALIHATYRQYLFEHREELPRSRSNAPNQKSSQMDWRDTCRPGIHAVAGQRMVCVDCESAT